MKLKEKNMNVEIDMERLRNDLINYYGPAMFNSSPLAIIELAKIENASSEELIQIAQNNNFNLENYISKGVKYVRK